MTAETTVGSKDAYWAAKLAEMLVDWMASRWVENLALKSADSMVLHSAERRASTRAVQKAYY